MPPTEIMIMSHDRGPAAGRAAGHGQLPQLLAWRALRVTVTVPGPGGVMLHWQRRALLVPGSSLTGLRLNDGGHENH
jgi:hypothetical protein